MQSTLAAPRAEQRPRWLAGFRERHELDALARVVGIVIFLRYVVMPVVGFMVNTTFPLERPEDFTVFGYPHLFWDIFARYDSGWFYSVAHDGYRYLPGEPNTFGFFPLYPMAMRYLAWALGGEQHHYFLAGMLISRVAFLAAIVVLYYLARLDLDVEGAQRAVLYTAIFPFAFFYSRVYSESLFLLLTVSAFYFFRTRRWELGGLAGGLASLTRVNGVLSGAALALIAVKHCVADRYQVARATIALAAVAGGLGAFSAYAYSVTGSPLAWASAIQSWDVEFGGAPWMPLIDLARQLVRRPYEFLAFEPNGPYDTLNGVTAGLFVVSIPFVWRRMGAAYGLHVLVNLWLPLSSGLYEGLGRYCAVLFPVFIWLASFRSSTVRDMIVVSSIALYVLCLSLFIKLHALF